MADKRERPTDRMSRGYAKSAPRKRRQPTRAAAAVEAKRERERQAADELKAGREKRLKRRNKTERSKP